eukprot:CAMPEP_0113645972 /NCGR_PEP_ID=MMETSP0017_2-20120614/24255_1 /TAXON_ID=2856 /ORGANISM="Cylindrotheca closterium" /LENGTH=591 /DNA_ID=CAMNT_0000557783 /DNA_START=26 /DNA_END=1797 /DNA_ORIENTATION=- /assembly_acc=CAM_ASM_000147
MEDSSSVAMQASNSSVAKIQAALLETLTESHVRTEVEACMSSMLLDVETTFSLQQQLMVHSNQVQVDRLAREQRATILEAEAERVAREQERMELADHFVKELLTLSQEMEKLLQWKKEHEHKVDSYDELLAKLVQTEEELESANRVSYGGSPKARQPETLEKESSFSAPEATESEKIDDGTEPSAALHVGSTADEPITEKPKVQEAEEPVVQETKEVEEQSSAEVPEEPSEEDQKPAAKSTPPIEEASPDTAAADVAVVLEEEEDDVPNLVEIDMEILMNIFGYLDAMDILNTAQINIEMYTRVDSIFGIAEDGHAMPQPTPAKPPAPSPAPKAPPSSAAPSVAKPPPTPQKPAPAPATDTGSGMGLFSSILQPRAPTARPNALPAKPSRPQPLNGNLAKSMASKLSDAELAAIISMTDKLSKLDKEVNLLRNEKEALTAKLDGTENVKKFLIAKVRDVEVKLKQREDEDVKITKQVTSDQEVIAFLDSRVQELERSTEEVTTERVLVQSELDSLKASSSKKAIMLNDMLKYEREKLREEESEWKATKKVLVKEVKSCRAQILALQAERDGFKEQNEMLKRAIVSTGKNHA